MLSQTTTVLIYLFLKWMPPVITNSVSGWRAQNSEWQARMMDVLKNTKLLRQNDTQEKKVEHQKLPPPYTDLNRRNYFQLVLILSPQICHLLKRKALLINSKNMVSIQL